MASRRPSIALLLVVALLPLVGPLAARAQTADQRQFIERDVPAKASAEDAVQARETAIAEGQVLALKRLMARLGRVDMARVPKVAPADVDRYVANFEIQREQIGARSYDADLTVTFRPEAVQDLMQRNGLSYGLVEVLPTVIMAYEPGGDPFADADPWRQAVLDAASRSISVDPILPLGDAQDLAVSEQAAQAGDRATLQGLADRYGARAVLVAAAAPQPAADGSGGLEIEGQYLDADGTVRALPTQTVPPSPDGSPDYAAAATALFLAVDTKVAQGVVRSDATVSLLPVAVPLADLAGWVQIRHALDDLPEVRTTKVERMSRKEARLVLGHVGSVDDLRAALQRRGLDLSQETEGWRLLRAGGRPVSSTVGG